MWLNWKLVLGFKKYPFCFLDFILKPRAVKQFYNRGGDETVLYGLGEDRHSGKSLFEVKMSKRTISWVRRASPRQTPSLCYVIYEHPHTCFFQLAGYLVHQAKQGRKLWADIVDKSKLGPTHRPTEITDGRSFMCSWFATYVSVSKKYIPKNQGT